MCSMAWTPNVRAPSKQTRADSHHCYLFSRFQATFRTWCVNLTVRITITYVNRDADSGR